MVSTYDLIIEGLSILLALGTVLVCLHARSFSRHIFLNLYLLACASFSLGCFYVRSAYGYTSLEYLYFYYTGDAILTVFAYLLIGSFFDYMLRQSIFRPYVRPTLAFFFLGVVGVSGVVIFRNLERFHAGRFLAEFQQNMFFVGVLLTFLLWISMTYLRAESRRFVLLVSGLGMYFSGHAANYAVQFLLHSKGAAEAMTRIPPLAYTVMVALWLYTFLRVPEGEPAAETARAGPREAAVPVHLSSG